MSFSFCSPKNLIIGKSQNMQVKSDGNTVLYLSLLMFSSAIAVIVPVTDLEINSSTLSSSHDRKQLERIVSLFFSCLLLQFMMLVNKGCKMSLIILDLGELNIPPDWSAACARATALVFIWGSVSMRVCVYRVCYLRLRLDPPPTDWKHRPELWWAVWVMYF